MLKAIVALMLLCVLSGYASADIIDDIRLKTDSNGEIDAVIKFTVPIQKLRYFPQHKSPYLVVFFNILDNVPRDQWQDYESHRSPPSDFILGFTVTTRDLNTGPKIDIQFARPVEFSLKAGKDGHSLLIHIKPDKPQQDKESKPTATQSGGVVIPPVVPPLTAAVPAIAATPKTALTDVAAPATSQVAAPQAAADVAAKQVQPPASVKPATAQLGGKDGLPPFPQIDQVTQAEPVPPEAGSQTSTEPPSLAEQVKKANIDAAILMAKGRDALLAGEVFAAIESFNSTLKLPPNKYTQDAQIWIGISREKSGQQAKAKLEYESYLKLYPEGTGAAWVKDRLSKLVAIQPAPLPITPQTEAVAAQNKKFQTTEYGSFSMYYYRGASHTDTIATTPTLTGSVQTPTSLTVTDQSSLISNVSMTTRTYNDEYDNRLVLQDFYAANLLPGQQNKNRLNAAFFETRNRVKDFSARIGRQSALGGGVLGRFDGVTGGYGFTPNWRANVVAGQLSDAVIGSKPVFYGASMDFGIKDPMGGSLYVINQTLDGITDRQATGGNLRYFDPKKTAIAMVDYDVQFKALNMVTLQGTVNGGESGTDYNFLLDTRKSPSLSLRNSVNGAFGTVVQTDASGNNPIQVNFAPTVSSLLQNGFTRADIIALANQRTATSNLAQVGMTNHLKANWQAGTDITVSNTSGMQASGTLNSDGTTGLEGYVPASPSTGNAWTISERLIGNDVLFSRDVTMFSLSYTKTPLLSGETLMANNHAYFKELWTVDTTLRLYNQTDKSGGKETVIAPMLKLGYRAKENLTLETEGGIELTKATPIALPPSKTDRKYFTVGFRWDF